MIAAALLRHFDAHRRDLPWRRDTDAYRVWVSEIMLQQTRVDTVMPYYERWMRQFPNVEALADAPLDRVLKAWEGLGYYSRARNLHAAARTVRERYSGRVPGTYAELKLLPGVGDYTAGAISSIAFGEREPVVDGNVSRVLHRLHDRPAIPVRELRALAAALVPEGRPGDFNQALMELGATICTPRVPRCDECPVARHCRAFARGTQLERPAPKAAKVIPERRINTLVILDARERVLITRRPATGLLAGLWEFPGTESDARAQLRALVGPTRARLRACDVVTHTFSHFRAHYHPHVARITHARPVSRPARWIAIDRLATLAMPVAQRRILEAAGLPAAHR